jgi:FkbM family methyltransferase
MLCRLRTGGAGGVTIDERRLAGHERGKATVQVNPVRERPSWQQRLRTYIVNQGIQVMCGSGGDVSAAAATDIPLVSGAARLAWLKALNAVGVTRFVATSGLGYEFVCHTGDLANFPFYHRRAYRAELELCAAWLQGEPNPVVYDIGANGGFFSTHLAQMLAGRAPRVYAFEPVPATFAKLAQAVQRLGLDASVLPVPAAVIDNPGPVRISYSERNSLLARVSPRGLNPRVGDKLAQAKGITLDEFCSSAGAFPKLLKIDVEGSETAVLRGARDMLSRPDRPAILFEYNPVALMESGSSVQALLDMLAGYTVHYVDDLGGQKIPFGDPVEAEEIDWTCNLFAVPLTRSATDRWASVLERSGGGVAGR